MTFTKILLGSFHYIVIYHSHQIYLLYTFAIFNLHVTTK